MGEPNRNREDYLSENGVSEDESGNFLIPRPSNSPTAKDLTEHLTEMRNRIIVSVLTLVAFISIAFYYSAEIMIFMQKAAPEGSSFFQLKPGELFMSSLKVAIFIGLSLSLPMLLYQLAEFLRPGLKDKEQKILSPIFWGMPLLFYLGVAFSYYMVLPPLLEFLLGFRPGVVDSHYGLEHFLNLELSILGLCGVCFQLPVLIVTLSQFGLVKSHMLISIWRYVILGAFIIAAVLTPTPDPMTMSIVASALLALYFITVMIMKFLGR